ncbi:unnamed protein product [Choristocarpus tenellus]
MDTFTLKELQSAFKESSVCIGIFDRVTGTITDPNDTLRRRLGRDEARISILASRAERIYGCMTQGNLPISLCVLCSIDQVSLVEVHIAHDKEDSLHSDLIQLVDLTSDGIWEWFPSLGYEFMSKRFWDILGYDYMEMENSPDAWRDKIDPADRESTLKMYLEHVKSKGLVPYHADVTYRHKDGHKVRVKCRGTVIEWLPDGSPWRLLGTHTDVTQIANKEAVEAKARFISRMSHEIRTPICAILNECELLGNLGGVSVIADSCAQLLTICNDILTLEKMQRAGQMEVVMQEASLEEFFMKIAKRHRGVARKKGISLSSTISSTIPNTVVMDVSKCNQVMDNLVSNSIKYTAVGGCIKLEMECQEFGPGWGVKVCVEDDGVGIAPEDHAHIFDEFKQGNSSMQGAGLGLSISKELARLMSGDVVLVKSVLGQGSVFAFSFPVRSGDTMLTSPPDKEPTHLRILIVDDMSTNRTILRRRVETIEGHTEFLVSKVVDAVDGSDAIRAFQENDGQFDLVFMDCLMPILDGFEATRRLHQICREMGRDPVPIVAVTASVSKSTHTNCQEAGMCNVITKPFSARDLLTSLMSVLPKTKLCKPLSLSSEMEFGTVT